MRILGMIIWLFLTNVSFSQSKPAVQAFHNKFLKNAPLSVTDPTFDQLTLGNRNHTFIVALTALQAQYGCQVCKEFQPEWELLAKTWANADIQNERKIIFGTLDFDDGKGTFQKLMLQTAPILLLYHPTVTNNEARSQPVRFDFLSGSQSAEQIQTWIVRQLAVGDSLTITRPLNYTRMLVSLVALCGIVTVFCTAHNVILPFIQSKNLWAGISLLTILLFISGHMFNHIRKVPYVTGDGHGGMTYITAGFSAQLGMESQIVAALYGALSLASVALATRVTRIQSATSQQIAIVIWAFVLFGVYGFLLSVFKIKNGGYPFYLPPF